MRDPVPPGRPDLRARGRRGGLGRAPLARRGRRLVLAGPEAASCDPCATTNLPKGRLTMDQSELLKRVAQFPPIEPNPILLEHARERAESVQNRIADQITRFAGSMMFVYIHVIWFGLWIALGVEAYPFGLLTMIVSLEAIFLSTFVMISQ